ncbi:initiator tRNA phosphoribosyl transferase-domain-containing protein [Tribonema minus]|uniref:Initiator tRNA phosphoribosyl transferase-domain-containing protein n=1 Tax=Tribonema minus TaxID=303371 RepID=A0A835YSK0_9STRA|nr:initiator tRNA phosphoribosyl transferase-domain-containing protein [Tribonema minus]
MADHVLWTEEECEPSVWTEADLAVLQDADFRADGKAPSVGKIARRLQQQSRHDLLNYLRSIQHDSHYITSALQAIRSRPGCTAFPAFANLRNGQWYGPPSAWEGTCYFKSADGHCGQWAFSYTRLNLHVACKAAMAGGCVVVDSTRRGKRFPDALTATVPLWCAVINSTLASIRGPDWDCSLHTPPWLSPSEASQIADRIAPSVAGLGTAADALRAQLGQHLARPLRPLWQAPGVPLSTEEGDLGDMGGLPFVPVICISASEVSSVAFVEQLALL